MRARGVGVPTMITVVACSAPKASAPKASAPKASAPKVVRSAPSTAPSASTSVTASSTSTTPISPEHASEIARILAVAKARGTAFDGGWQLNEKACIEAIRDRCSHIKKFEYAFVRLHAKGRALSIVVVWSCGGDRCNTNAWLHTDVRPARSVPEPPFVVTPDLAWLIFDRITLIAPGTWDSRLARLDLVTGAVAPFADCVSPSLSPGEKWIACRTTDSSVYRVPIDGGKPLLVRKGPGLWSWVPYAHVFPPPISFPSSTTFAVEEGAGPNVFPWNE